jgi:hypothetical protein
VVIVVVVVVQLRLGARRAVAALARLRHGLSGAIGPGVGRTTSTPPVTGVPKAPTEWQGTAVLERRRESRIRSV